MSKGIYKRKPCSEETKEKMSKSAKKRHESGEIFGFQKGHGNKHSFESRKKISESTKKRHASGEIFGFQKGETNDKHHSWKGDNVGFRGMHIWVAKEKGKASEHDCVDCGNQAYHWSNIDHKYKRTLDDYQARCVKCHKKYDIETIKN